MKNTRPITGGVCAPLDFVGGAAACGIKNGTPSRDDLALIASKRIAAAAGTFTTNKVKAAPVLLSQKHIRKGAAWGVILNSGNANACTGEPGLITASRMAKGAAEKLGTKAEEILVCSTGRIGVALPVERIEAALPALKLQRSGSLACAKAIMTSDTFPKQISLEVKSKGKTFRIGGIAKGAGMIDPNMATMLCVVTTDADLSAAELRKFLRTSVENSFNRITIDGDMSTNDTVIALANGASGVKPDAEIFQAALDEVTQTLARQIVLDGEGVSKFVEVEVKGAASQRDARLAAEAIANSTLVKCAWAGGDPNWGRIMDALGYCGAKLRESIVAIDYDDLPIVRGGQLAPTPWKKLQAVAAKKSFRILVDLGLGKGSHLVWTTDLTEEYVRLNLGE